MEFLALSLQSLSNPTDILLIATSFIGSLISAALGIGGGTLMLAVIAQTLPVAAIIPVHGVVQFGSNLGRALLLIKHVQWTFFFAFTAGALIGALIGGQLVVSLPAQILKPALGAFILYSVWGSKLKPDQMSLKALGFGGTITTFLTMFVGATGPFVLSLIRTFGLPPAETVSTNSACILMQHTLKIVVFGLLGFNFYPYASLIAAMLAAGFAGTYLGKMVLVRTAPERFDAVLKLILSALALRLLWPF